MSGECDDCGEHALDCTCNEREINEEYTSPVAIRDKCDRVLGLMICLQFVVDTPNFQDYHRKPHHDLMMAIEDEIKEIEQSLRKL